MTKPTILVTGATGWLGSRLVGILLDGHPDRPDAGAAGQPGAVRCLVQPGAGLGHLEPLAKRVELVEGDVTDGESLGRFFADSAGALVFHCAGLIHPRLFVSDLFAVNERGTRNVVDHARRAGVRRLVHVSSNSPCGCNPSPDHTFDESSPHVPYMSYGRSKARGEEIVRGLGSGGPEWVIVRAPWFYGPNQPDRQTLFFKMIREGWVPLVGDGTNRRSMAYVDNLCLGLVLCGSVERARGEVYWIADRRPYSMNEILETIERVLETDFRLTVAHRRTRLPGLVGTLATIADSLAQGVGLYHQKIHVLSEMNKTIACSIEKARDQLGYEPTVDLEEGMRRSIRWVLDRGGSIG